MFWLVGIDPSHPVPNLHCWMINAPQQIENRGAAESVGPRPQSRRAAFTELRHETVGPQPNAWDSLLE